jgi:hypothetical protein
MAKIQVSNEDFVRAVLANTSYAGLAAAIGLSKASAQSRVNALRKLGVNLPKYERVKSSRAKKTVDVAALNALLA